MCVRACVCVFVPVCVSEREKEKGKTLKFVVRVCVCVHVCWVRVKEREKEGNKPSWRALTYMDCYNFFSIQCMWRSSALLLSIPRVRVGERERERERQRRGEKEREIIVYLSLTPDTLSLSLPTRSHSLSLTLSLSLFWSECVSTQTVSWILSPAFDSLCNSATPTNGHCSNFFKLVSKLKKFLSEKNPFLWRLRATNSSRKEFSHTFVDTYFAPAGSYLSSAMSHSSISDNHSTEK